MRRSPQLSHGREPFIPPLLLLLLSQTTSGTPPNKRQKVSTVVCVETGYLKPTPVSNWLSYFQFHCYPTNVHLHNLLCGPLRVDGAGPHRKWSFRRPRSLPPKSDLRPFSSECLDSTWVVSTRILSGRLDVLWVSEFILLVS